MKWVKDPDGNPEMFGDQPGYPEATEIGSNFEVGMVRSPDLCERLVLRPIEACFCKEDFMLPVFFFFSWRVEHPGKPDFYDFLEYDPPPQR